MITVPIWQILVAIFVASFISFLLGVVAMACMAMASYDGDEERSEPE